MRSSIPRVDSDLDDNQLLRRADGSFVRTNKTLKTNDFFRNAAGDLWAVFSKSCDSHQKSSSAIIEVQEAMSGGRLIIVPRDLLQQFRTVSTDKKISKIVVTQFISYSSAQFELFAGTCHISLTLTWTMMTLAVMTTTKLTQAKHTLETHIIRIDHRTFRTRSRTYSGQHYYEPVPQRVN